MPNSIDPNTFTALEAVSGCFHELFMAKHHQAPRRNDARGRGATGATGLAGAFAGRGDGPPGGHPPGESSTGLASILSIPIQGALRALGENLLAYGLTFVNSWPAKTFWAGLSDPALRVYHHFSKRSCCPRPSFCKSPTN